MPIPIAVKDKGRRWWCQGCGKWRPKGWAETTRIYSVPAQTYYDRVACRKCIQELLRSRIGYSGTREIPDWGNTETAQEA